jgi:hypothetical protein
MADNAKRAALIAEGLSEGEADYMTSGGAKSEGLTPPADGDATPAPAKPSVEVREAGEVAPVGAAPAATPVPEPDEDEPPQNTPVPYQRFKREKDRLAKRAADLTAELTVERTARGTAEQSANAERERMARLGERLANLAVEPAAAAVEPAKPVPAPDPEADPIGYLKYLGEQVTGLAGRTDQVATTVQERDAATNLENTYVADARQFVARQPDFGQAYTWLMVNRDAELKAAGYTDPAERNRIILADERDIVARAVQARQKDPNAAGPTQILYGLAKARGYTVAAPAAPASPAMNGAAAPAANGAAAPSVTAQVEAIQRGQAASRSLSSGGGAPAPAAIDLSKIADMSDAEYLEFKRSITPAQRAELNGLMGAPAR